jgi:hypothetical protein
MPDREEELREVAKQRMRDLPGETAGGRIDPATLPDRAREDLASRAPDLDEEDLEAPTADE